MANYSADCRTIISTEAELDFQSMQKKGSILLHESMMQGILGQRRTEIEHEITENRLPFI